MNPPQHGSFSFRTVRRPAATSDSLILQPLLIEAAGMQDELERFEAAVSPRVRLKPTGKEPSPDIDVESDLVDQIRHELTMESTGWGTLADRLPFSRGRVALAVRAMLRDDVITKDE